MHTGIQEPVLVVGAGPVGLAAAINLALKDYPVRIVEARSEPSTYSKAIGINARTLELLEPTGVTDHLLDAGLKILRINFQNAHSVLFTVDFSKAVHRYNFMLALPQSETERILERRLNELGVHVERNVSLKRLEQRPNSVIGYLAVDGREEEFEASYVIGSDGAHSTVRRQLGIDFPGHRMRGDWSLADVAMDSPLQAGAANVVFGNDGMLFAIEFRPGVYRIASERPKVIERLPEGSVVHEVLWESDFAVSHRLAEHYAVGRVLLAGDAAHLHSPLGARGMNLGIEDAATLVSALSLSNPQQYSRARLAVSKAVVRMVKAQTRLATSTGPLVRFVRAKVIPRALGIGAVHQRLAERMLGLGHQRSSHDPVHWDHGGSEPRAVGVVPREIGPKTHTRSS